jgi:hypothetical protein
MARQLDKLSVDGGIRILSINTTFSVSAFRYLDGPNESSRLTDIEIITVRSSHVFGRQSIG